MKELIKTEDLTHEFSPGKGAVGIDISLKSGEILGFIGPNGAGKTTTIRMLMGLLRPQQGTLKLFGDTISYFSDFPDYYGKMGFLPSEPAYFDNLTPRKMFELKASLSNSSGIMKDAYSYAQSLDLDVNKPIKRLSLGNKRKVGFILSILGNPEIIILDEPTTGLDPLIQRKALEILEEHTKRGAGIFLSSHNLAEVEYVCDRVVIIKESRIIFSGGIKEIKSKASKKIVIPFSNKSDLKKLLLDVQVDKQSEYASTIEIYTKDHVKLTKNILSLGISDFTVENPTLEEMFIDYYK